MPKAIILILQAFLTVTSFSQVVAVRDEPRHHKVFENNYIRILDVRVSPGDTTLFHKHETPSVFIMLHSVNTGSELITEAKERFPKTPGVKIWYDPIREPRIHRIWNKDTTEFHVMDIELLNKPPFSTDSSFITNSPQLLFDEKEARAFQLHVIPNHSISLYQTKIALLFICLTDRKEALLINDKPLSKKGDYIFIQRGDALSLKNYSTEQGELVIIELK